MTRRVTRLIAGVVLVFGVGLIAACGSSSTPIAPAPVQTTDTITGVLNPLGTDAHNFTVNYSAGYTDATVTITSLKTVSTGTPLNITIGIAFGTTNLGFCTTSSAVSNPTFPFNSPQQTQGTPFIGPQQYCIQAFDNPAAPTVPEPIAYTLTLLHS